MSELETLILTYLGWEGVPSRYIKAKSSGAISDNVGLFTQMSSAINAFKAKKNIILLGGVGRGKSFFAYDLAFRIKISALRDFDKHNYPILCNRASVMVSDFKSHFSNIGTTLDSLMTYHSYANSNIKIGVKSLIIDEIDDIGTNDYILLNELIISAYESVMPLILISNKSAESFFANFSDKALSRLNANSLIIQAKGADLRQKV